MAGTSPTSYSNLVVVEGLSFASIILYRFDPDRFALACYGIKAGSLL